jgi:hypothetical protein
MAFGPNGSEGGPLGPQSARVCGGSSGDTTRAAAGFSGSLRSRSGEVFLAEWLGIGDPLPLIAFKLANATAVAPLTLDAMTHRVP